MVASLEDGIDEAEVVQDALQAEFDAEEALLEAVEDEIGGLEDAYEEALDALEEKRAFVAGLPSIADLNVRLIPWVTEKKLLGP